MRMKKFTVVIWALIASACCYPVAVAAEDLDVSSDKETGLRAQLCPKRFTTLSSELAAKIKKLDLQEGDRFKKGDVLVGFDCTVERARLLKARAQWEVAKKRAEVSRRLAELDSISIMEVEKSLAEVMEAEADIVVMEAIIDKCVIFAPFSGRVSILHARVHQFVSAGQPLLEILDDHDLEVELLIPSQWLMWLKTGKEFLVQIDETGKKYSAKVRRIGASIDPISQSVKIMGKIYDPDGELLSGMSGHAFFQSEISNHQ